MKGLRDMLQVCFRVKGLRLERFLYNMEKAGYALKKVKREGNKTLTCQSSLSGFSFAEELAQRKGWTVTDKNPVGLYSFLIRGKKRLGICIGVLLVCVALIFSLQFLWGVEVRNGQEYASEIRAWLKTNGIDAGTPVSMVDVKEISRQLEWRLPLLAWVRTEKKGPFLVITCVKGTPVPATIDEGETGNVVAARDGLVLSVRTYAGTPCCKPGDMVHTGDVLIAGTEKGLLGEETVAVRARGDVQAQVWETVEVVLRARREVSTPTGRTTSVQTLYTPFFHGEVPASPYRDCDVETVQLPVGGVFFPVWVETTAWHEVTLSRESCPEEELYRQAEQAMMRRFYEKEGIKTQILDKWIDYSMIDSEKLSANLALTMQMQIGVFLTQAE